MTRPACLYVCLLGFAAANNILTTENMDVNDTSTVIPADREVTDQFPWGMIGKTPHCIFILPVSKSENREVHLFYWCGMNHQTDLLVRPEPFLECLRQDVDLVAFVNEFVRAYPWRHPKCLNQSNQETDPVSAAPPSVADVVDSFRKLVSSQVICQLSYVEGLRTRNFATCILPKTVALTDDVPQEKLAALSQKYCSMVEQQDPRKTYYYSMMSGQGKCEGLAVFEVHKERKTSNIKVYATMCELVICLPVLIFCLAVFVAEACKKFQPVNAYFITICLDGLLIIVVTHLSHKESFLLSDRVLAMLYENVVTCYLLSIMDDCLRLYYMVLISALTVERYFKIARPFASVTANRSASRYVCIIVWLLVLTIMTSTLNTIISVSYLRSCEINGVFKTSGTVALVTGSAPMIISWVVTLAFATGTIWSIAKASLRRARMGAQSTASNWKGYSNVILSSISLVVLSVPEVYMNAMYMLKEDFALMLWLSSSADFSLIVRPLFATTNSVIFLLGSVNFRRGMSATMSRCLARCSSQGNNA